MFKNAFLLGICAAASLGASAQTYQITIEDLTTGQPFSPPVIAVHDSSETLFAMGSAASQGIIRIAEEGDRSVMVADLSSRLGGSVKQLETPLSSPLLPGGSVSVTVTVDAAHPYLSMAWMLGRTNDGFSGMSRLDLSNPANAGVYLLNGYDAGTEMNNELATHLIALGGHQRALENGVIHAHGGILGIADAPLSWDWNDPVARVTVRAVPEPGAISAFVTGLSGLAFVRLRRKR